MATQPSPNDYINYQICQFCGHNLIMPEDYQPGDKLICFNCNADQRITTGLTKYELKEQVYALGRVIKRQHETIQELGQSIKRLREALEALPIQDTPEQKLNVKMSLLNFKPSERG